MKKKGIDVTASSFGLKACFHGLISLSTKDRNRRELSNGAKQRTEIVESFPTSQTGPLLRSSAPPLLRSSAPPLLRASAPPLLRSSAPPLLRSSAPPLLPVQFSSFWFLCCHGLSGLPDELSQHTCIEKYLVRRCFGSSCAPDFDGLSPSFFALCSVTAWSVSDVTWLRAFTCQKLLTTKCRMLTPSNFLLPV